MSTPKARKIICIGECALDIVFGPDGSPLGAMPGGHLANAAALLAEAGQPVAMCSEAAADAVGDTVVRKLEEAGVNTRSVDRFTEGRTPVTVFMPDATGQSTPTRYECYPDDCFDIIWPDIAEGDIVMFGGYYAIDRRMRRRMLQMLQHAAERKTLLVYLPGYLPVQEPRITRVMPAILENMELAHMVCTRSHDLKLIFGNADADACWRTHISFYCSSMLNVDENNRTLTYFARDQRRGLELPMSECSTLVWNAGATAGAVKALFEAEATPEVLEQPHPELGEAIVREAVAMADTSIEALPDDWRRHHV